STSGMGWRWCSRSNPTITRRRLSPTRGRRPAWAASFGTSLRWAPDRSPSWTRCASARSSRAATATCSRGWSPVSVATAIVPAVQVGNPFLEKLLCEACLRLNQLDGVTAIQDLGAAGLTSAAAELAHRGRRGIDIDVARISRREREMSAYDVMLSESQERMLVVVRPEAETAVRQVFDHFELHADRIGSITSSGRVRVRDEGAVVADIPLKVLVDGVPARSPASEVPDKQPSLGMPSIEEPEAVLLDLI